jgi:hypothetical protein
VAEDRAGGVVDVVVERLPGVGVSAPAVFDFAEAVLDALDLLPLPVRLGCILAAVVLITIS